MIATPSPRLQKKQIFAIIPHQCFSLSSALEQFYVNTPFLSSMLVFLDNHSMPMRKGRREPQRRNHQKVEILLKLSSLERMTTIVGLFILSAPVRSLSSSGETCVLLTQYSSPSFSSPDSSPLEDEDEDESDSSYMLPLYLAIILFHKFRKTQPRAAKTRTGVPSATAQDGVSTFPRTIQNCTMTPAMAMRLPTCKTDQKPQ